MNDSMFKYLFSLGLGDQTLDDRTMSYLKWLIFGGPGDPVVSGFRQSAGTGGDVIGIQSYAIDQVNGNYYTQHLSALDEGVITRYSISGPPVKILADQMLPAAQIGHQGLGVEQLGGANIRLWTTAATPSRSAIRYQYVAGGAISDVQIYTLFGSAFSTAVSCTPAISTDQKWLIAHGTRGGASIIRVFSLSRLISGGPGDYSNLYSFEFQTVDLVDSTHPNQGIACDGANIWIVSGGSNINLTRRLHCYSLAGDLLYRNDNCMVGAAQGALDGTGTRCEPEGLFFSTDSGGAQVLNMGIASGDIGAWFNRAYQVGATRADMSSCAVNDLWISLGAQLAYPQLTENSIIWRWARDRALAQNSLNDSTGTLIQYSIQSIFSGGKAGAWYDPSDFSSMFQDTAGTIPVTAAGQSVARINDKSGNGNHLIQATAASMPTIQLVGGGWALVLDGVNDFMSCASFPFNASSASMWTADALTSEGNLIEMSTNSSSVANPGTLYCVSGPTRFRFRSSGSVVGVLISANVPGPKVSYSTADIAQAVEQIIVNWEVSENSVVTQGVGTYGTYPLFLGSRNGTSLFSGGPIYGVVIVGGLVSNEVSDIIGRIMNLKLNLPLP